MIKDAESSGLIKIGDTLIEATSGNTGVAPSVALAKGESLMKQSLRPSKTPMDPSHTSKWLQNVS